MKKWDARKLMVSSLIFLFTVMSAAPKVVHAAPGNLTEVQGARKHKAKSPYVQMHAPKIVKLDNMGDETVRGSRLYLREVEDSEIVANALMNLALPSETQVIETDQDYGTHEGAFVNLGGTNFDGIHVAVASRIAEVMNSPQKYGLEKQSFDVQSNPRLIEVATVDVKNQMTKSHVLAMDVKVSRIDKVNLKNTLNTIYSTFKGYVDVVRHRAVGQQMQIHTGLLTGVNTRVTTVLQIMAADLAGIHQLIFHSATNNPGVIQDAQKFMDEHKGQGVSVILDALQESASQNRW